MKIPAEVVGNMMYAILADLVDNGDLGSTRHGELDMKDFDEAGFALDILRALAEKKKRIHLEVTY